MKRPKEFILPEPNAILTQEEKLEKQALEMLNMAQVNFKSQINLLR